MSETNHGENLPRMRPPGSHPAAENQPPETSTTSASTTPDQATTPEPGESPTPAGTDTRKTSRPWDRLLGRDSDSDSAAFGPTAANPESTKTLPTDAEVAAFLDKSLLAEDISQGLQAASEAANDRFAAGTPWLIADQREADGIATPVARIIARHAPAGLGGAGNPDLADAMAAGITLVRYARRQIRLFFEIKRAQAAGPPAGDEQEAMA